MSDHFKAEFDELMDLWKQAERMFREQIPNVEMVVDDATGLLVNTKLGWMGMQDRSFRLCAVRKNFIAKPVLESSSSEKTILALSLSNLYVKCLEESEKRRNKLAEAIEVLKTTIKEWKHG